MKPIASKWRFEVVPHGNAEARVRMEWPTEKVLVFRDDELVAQVFATEGVQGVQIASDKLDLTDPMTVLTAKEFNEIVSSVSRGRPVDDAEFVPWVAFRVKGERLLTRDGSRR